MSKKSCSIYIVYIGISTITINLRNVVKDSKKTWQTKNEVLVRKKGDSDIPQRFVSDDTILSGSLEIAEGFKDLSLMQALI